MRAPTIGALALAALASAVAPARADVRLTMVDGQVSLTATNATVREILAEWARVGQTKIVNAERVTGAPMTIQLTGVPEEEALQVILRAVSGYVAAPRPTDVPNASRFDRILIVPTTTPARPAPAAPPLFPQPRVGTPQLPVSIDSNDDLSDEEEVEPPNVRVPFPRGPIFNSFPQPQVPQGGQPATQGPPPQGQAPVGVAVPGMVVPAPTPTGQPVIPPPPDPDPDDR